MAEIDPLNSGFVIIKKGQKAEAKILPETEDKPEQIEITLTPGKTAAKELIQMLNRLNITCLPSKHMSEIGATSGDNGIFDNTELISLDAKLESIKTTSAINELVKAKLGFEFEWKSSPEKLLNPRYVKSVRKMAAAGISIHPSMLLKLSFEKGIDVDYVNSLIKLKKSGVEVDSEVIDGILLTDGKNQNFITLWGILAGDCTVVEQGGGEHVLVPCVLEGYNEVAPEKRDDSILIHALDDLEKSGIYFDVEMINAFSPEQYTNQNYIKALKELHNTGIGIDEGMIGNLTPEKGGNLEYIKILKELRSAGIKVDSNLVRWLTLEKTESSDYMKAFIELHKVGIKVSEIITSLTLEKGSNSDYIKALIKLHEAGIDLQSHRYFQFIDTLTLKKAKDSNYIKALIELHEANIWDDDWLVEHLTIEKAKNPVYLQILKNYKDCKGDFSCADFAYIRKITGVNLFDNINISGLINLYDKYYRDDVSEQILFLFLKQRLLVLVQSMNELHSSPDAERLREIQGLSAEQLGMLTICGREEVYTSTFNLIFGQLIEEMKENNLDAYALINNIDPFFRNYRALLTTCAAYGRLKEFLDTIKDTIKKEELLHKFVTEVDLSKDKLQDSVSIAELMIYEKDAAILGALEKYLLEAYKTSANPQDKILYSIIGAAYYAERHIGAFKEFYDIFPLPSVTSIKQTELLSVKMEVVEQQYFYNDEDGKMNFDEFIKVCKADSSWKIADIGTYMLISKTNASGIKLSIYANKPEQEGMEDIHKKFEKNGIQPTIIVHRGHSFHVYKTIENISSAARIVYLGSCGGFNSVYSVLGRAPKASIIGTKGKGTITINAPLLMNIHEALLDSNVLEWKAVWDKTEKQVKNKYDFSFYVRPDKNIAAQLINAYNHSSNPQ